MGTRPLVKLSIYLFIYLFHFANNYMYMKTTNQNSHTHTEERKKTLFGRDTTTAFADSHMIANEKDILYHQDSKGGNR